MKSRSRGFTLFELMVVLALATVILGLGVPSFRDFQRNNRLTVAANDVLSMLMASRAEALRRQTVVSMCASASSPDDADATCGAGNNWLVFDDENADCVRTDDEEIISTARIDTDVKAKSNTTCISFATSGFRRVVAGQPSISHMLYCDDRGNVPRNSGTDDSFARGVEVLPTGRGAVIKSVTELDNWDIDAEAICL